MRLTRITKPIGRYARALIEIDGGQGEGGGQVLRTALSLSACLGKPVTIRNIRANRRVAGLRPQHLTAVRAIAQICGVAIEDLSVGQTTLVFQPRPAQAGAYTFQVGTAGSTCLVLQTVALPLAFAGGSSIIKITGGTHNPKAPCFEYLVHTWVPFLRELGLRMGLGMQRAGFYPHGGGTLVAQVDGGATPEGLKPMDLVERGEMTSHRALIKIANEPINVGYRLKKTTLYEMGRHHIDPVEIKIELIEALDRAGICVIWAEFEHSRTASVGVTGKGKTPEAAASEAVGGLADFLDQARVGRPAVDPHAADQLMLPLALIPGTSRFTTTKITSHCLTNADVIRQITGRSVEIEGDQDKPGTVTIT